MGSGSGSSTASSGSGTDSTAAAGSSTEVHSGCQRGVTVNECNAPLATRVKAVLVEPKQQGLAFVVVEREDGSRSGETAPGRSRGRRE
ncbi:hypothetical protein INR49_003124 [Caranx melampygus]|nr:hypothetical protein INR49_003124 [Caranx melampygus]